MVTAHQTRSYSTVQMNFTLNLNKHVLKHSEMLRPLISSSLQLPDAGPVVAQAEFHLHRG